jgi:hypothetical protein
MANKEQKSPQKSAGKKSVKKPAVPAKKDAKKVK